MIEILLCFHQGFKYAATQAGSHCFCGDSYDKYGKTNNCNSPCAANRAEKCGGGWANQVYKLPKKGKGTKA